MRPLTISWVVTFTSRRSQTAKRQSVTFNIFFFSFSRVRHVLRSSTVWHTASFHAWQKSVQEAYHYYCQIGTAVYSSIMQSSLILSLTVTCFTLAPSLTLIYSSTLSAAWEEKTSSQHLLLPNRPVPISYFSFSFVLKISQTSQLFCASFTSLCTFS